jgi:hypothetical protein
MLASSAKTGSGSGSGSKPLSGPTTEAAAGATESELRLELLTEKDWKLPQWRNIDGAESALLKLLGKAGNAAALRSQLTRGVDRLSGLSVKGEDMRGFREGYKELRELGLRVQAGEGGKGEFGAALLSLLLHADRPGPGGAA